MSKAIVVLCAILGAFAAFVLFAPTFFTRGFHVDGHLVSFAIIGMCAIGYLGYRLKG